MRDKVAWKVEETVGGRISGVVDKADYERNVAKAKRDIAKEARDTREELAQPNVASNKVLRAFTGMANHLAFCR